MPRRPNRFAHERFTGTKLVINVLVIALFFAGWALFDATNDLDHESSLPPPPAETTLPSPASTTTPPSSPPVSGSVPGSTATSEPTRAPSPTPTRRSRAS